MLSVDIAILITFLIYSAISLAPLIIFFLIIKVLCDSIRRANSEKYFKTTIVFNDVNQNSKKNNEIDTTHGKKNIYTDVSQKELDRFNIEDIDSLKDYLYDIFYRFENAYNNLDYNEMRLLSTEQLFQKYHTGIALNLKIGKKKVINDIKRKKVVLYEVDSTVAKQVASAMIVVSYISYTLNKDGYIISGNRENPTIERFEVEFRKDFNREELTNCPNCGAALHGNKCDYCKSFIKNTDFQISAIRKIVDR